MPPIAAYLELDRLRHREARLVRALTVLEARAARLRVAGLEVPAALENAIVGFRDDLADIRAQLS